MRVRILVSISGPAYTARPGDELPLDDAEAGRLIAAGFAVALKAGESGNPPVVTTDSTLPPPVENTSSKAAAKSRKAVGRAAKGGR